MIKLRVKVLKLPIRLFYQVSFVFNNNEQSNNILKLLLNKLINILEY